MGRSLVFPLILSSAFAGACSRGGASGVASSSPAVTPAAVAAPASGPAARRVDVAVSDVYAPDTIAARAGEPLSLVFTRTTDDTCGTAVEIPLLHVSEPLPLGKPVAILVTPARPGTIDFTCAMHMMHGQIVVK